MSTRGVVTGLLGAAFGALVLRGLTRSGKPRASRKPSSGPASVTAYPRTMRERMIDARAIVEDVVFEEETRAIMEKKGKWRLGGRSFDRNTGMLSISIPSVVCDDILFVFVEYDSTESNAVFGIRGESLPAPVVLTMPEEAYESRDKHRLAMDVCRKHFRSWLTYAFA